jgi:DNA-binding response OmpR family regulator
VRKYTENKAKISILHLEDSDSDYIQIKLALDQYNPNWQDNAILYRAKTVKEARSIIEKARPQLLLLDLNLPGVSGHDFLSELKSDPSTSVIPVLVLSNSDADGDVIRAYHNYASCYLVKPASFAKLVAIMASVHSFWLEHATLPP